MIENPADQPPDRQLRPWVANLGKVVRSDGHDKVARLSAWTGPGLGKIDTLEPQ